MLRFLRKLRQKEFKGRYLKYAIGEIFLVVIGILIALQINNWNEAQKDHKLKVFYMNSVKNDLAKDTLDINRVVALQQADNAASIHYLNRLYDPLCTMDTIINIVRNEYDYRFFVKREYANNTFNTLISTGNIELLDKELTQKLMDLNSLQQDQLKRFYSHMGYFERLLSDYVQKYPIYDTIPENTLVGKIIWEDVNEKQLVGSFISILGLRKLMFQSTIGGHLKVKEQSGEVLQLLDELLKE